MGDTAVLSFPYRLVAAGQKRIQPTERLCEPRKSASLAEADLIKTCLALVDHIFFKGMEQKRNSRGKGKKTKEEDKIIKKKKRREGKGKRERKTKKGQFVDWKNIFLFGSFGLGGSCIATKYTRLQPPATACNRLQPSATVCERPSWD